MHTKKRHQNMFQDLNRKLHHADKDRESPASDSKVTYHANIINIHLQKEINLWRMQKKTVTLQKAK